MLLQHRDDINAVTFSPDNKFVLTGSDDQSIRLWDLKGNNIQTFPGQRGPINSLSFFPSGKRILAGIQYGGINILDLISDMDLYMEQANEYIAPLSDENETKGPYVNRTEEQASEKK